MSDAPARLSISHQDSVLVVNGEIDAHTAPDLEQAVAEFAAGADARIDMSGIEFIDSSGLRVLIDLHTRLESEGHRLLLERPSRSVTRLLEVSGLTDHLNVEG